MSIRLRVVKAVFIYQKVVVHCISMLISVLTFFFVPREKSSVSSLGCFCCFFFFLKFFVGMSSLSWVFIIHVFGVHQYRI